MVEGEHGEKGFHVRFGPQPMDLIIVARRLACGSSKSRPCSLSRIGVGKTRVRSAETLVNGGFLLSVYAFFFSLLQSEKRKEGGSDSQISAAVAQMEGKQSFSCWPVEQHGGIQPTRPLVLSSTRQSALQPPPMGQKEKKQQKRKNRG